MLDRLFGIKIQNHLQTLGLSILAFGVPMNKVLMSIGTIWLASNLLLKWDFKNNWEKWKKNAVFWFIIAVLGLHLIGLTYTKDFLYAINDLNAKLPLFVIPTVLIAFPVEQKYLKYVFYAFLCSLLITSAINFNYIIENGTYNYREYSLFGSHIRYALIAVTGILVAVYLLLRNRKLRWFFFIIICWLSYYTIISQVLSGYVAFLFLLFALLIYLIIKAKSKKIRYSIILAGIAFITAVLLIVFKFIDAKTIDFNFSTLPEKSKSGEVYFHDTTSLWLENGHHVLSFMAEGELEKEWNKRSNKLKYFDKYEDGYIVRDILIRYMASKGLTKDKEGLQKMTNEDIQNVEYGISTIVYTYNPIKRKLHILNNELLQYKIGGNPNGNSLLEKLEQWKAAKKIISKNWMLGVGTGDIQNVFNAEYEKSNSLLSEENRNRAHNQFLTFWIAFGIVGFLIFTVFWFWFLYKNIKLKNLIGIGFTLIAVGSFLSEDTIETQQGVTYIALFMGVSLMMNFFSIKKYSPPENKNQALRGREVFKT